MYCSLIIKELLKYHYQNEFVDNKMIFVVEILTWKKANVLDNYFTKKKQIF